MSQPPPEADATWHAAKAVFLAALDEPTSARADLIATSGLDAAAQSLLYRMLELDGGADTEAIRLDLPTVADEATPPFEPGDRLGGRYLLGAPLGAGSHGWVFAATDGITGRSLAIKTLRPSPARDRLATRAEMAALRRLRLPGVVRLLDEGEDDGIAWLAMEQVSGRPFPGGLATWTELRDPLIGLLVNLSRVHAAGVVHCDLKPGNLIVRTDRRIAILDLGVARSDPRRTVEGDLALRPAHGTRHFVAPEVERGAPTTCAADVYSLGVMLDEAIGGAADLPVGVRHAIDRAREPDPERRWRDAAELLAAMEPDWIGRRVHDALDGLHPSTSGRDARWRENDLAPLFGGHEPFVHEPSRAARALVRRTEGDDARVRRELSEWLASGVAAWRPDGRLDVDLDLADHLLAWPPSGARRSGPIDLESLSADVLTAAACVLWLSPVEATRIGPVVGWPASRVAAALDEGRRAGLWEEDGDGTIRAAAALRALPTNGGERFDRAVGAFVSRLADDDKAAGRFVVAVGGGPWAAHCAVPAVRVLRRAGLTRLSLETGRELWLRQAHVLDVPSRARLLSELLQSALAIGTEEAFNVFLQATDRSRAGLPEAEVAIRIARAAQLFGQGDVRRALASLGDALPETWTEYERTFEASWHAVRVRIALVLPRTEHARIVREAGRWAKRSGRVEAIALRGSWLAWLAYVRWQYGRALALHEAAARAASGSLLRAASLTNAATAALDGGRMIDAERLAEQALGVLAQAAVGVPSIEARATWIHRSARYRRGAPPAPEPALHRAAWAHGLRPNDGCLALTDAATCWREGHLVRARKFARRAHAAFAPAGMPEFAALAASLVVASGGRLRRQDIAQVRAALERSFGGPKRLVGRQGLALLEGMTPVRHGVPVSAASPRWEVLHPLEVEAMLPSMRGAPEVP